MELLKKLSSKVGPSPGLVLVVPERRPNPPEREKQCGLYGFFQPGGADRAKVEDLLTVAGGLGGLGPSGGSSLNRNSVQL